MNTTHTHSGGFTNQGPAANHATFLDMPDVLPLSGICPASSSSNNTSGNSSAHSLHGYPCPEVIIPVVAAPLDAAPSQSYNRSNSVHSFTSNTTVDANDTECVKEETADKKVHDWETANVFVANTPAEWSEDDLRIHYEPHGEIVSVRLVSQRRFGFVRFKTVEQAREAILQTDRKRPSPKIPWMLHVSMAVHDEGDGQEPNNRIFVRCLPNWCTDAQLRESVSRITAIALQDETMQFAAATSTTLPAATLQQGSNAGPKNNKTDGSDQSESLMNTQATDSTTPSHSQEIDPVDDTQNTPAKAELLSEVDLTPVCSVLIDPQGRCKGTGFIEFTKVDAARRFLDIAVGRKMFSLDGFNETVELKYAERAESRAQRATRNKDRVVKHLTEKVRQKAQPPRPQFTVPNFQSPPFPVMINQGYPQPMPMYQPQPPYASMSMSGSSTSSYSHDSGMYHSMAGPIPTQNYPQGVQMQLSPPSAHQQPGLLGSAPQQHHMQYINSPPPVFNTGGASYAPPHPNHNVSFIPAPTQQFANQQPPAPHYNQQQPANFHPQQQQANQYMSGSSNNSSGMSVVRLPDGTYAAVQPPSAQPLFMNNFSAAQQQQQYQSY